MENAISAAGAAWEGYWTAAVEPLHRLTWQTGTMFATLFVAGALFATLLVRYSWLLSKPTIRSAKVNKNHHMYRDHLRVSPAEYLSFHRLKTDLSIEQAPAADIVKKDSTRYYVVTVVEAGKRRPILYKEMRLQVPSRRGRVVPGYVQFDQEVLTEIRLNNGFEEDDNPESEIVGQYDVYIRKVRWYDIRHWLLHPNREIRIVIWVTLITTTLPVLLDILFG